MENHSRFVQHWTFSLLKLQLHFKYQLLFHFSTYLISSKEEPPYWRGIKKSRQLETCIWPRLTVTGGRFRDLLGAKVLGSSLKPPAECEQPLPERPMLIIRLEPTSYLALSDPLLSFHCLSLSPSPLLRSVALPTELGVWRIKERQRQRGSLWPNRLSFPSV